MVLVDLSARRLDWQWNYLARPTWTLTHGPEGGSGYNLSSGYTAGLVVRESESASSSSVVTLSNGSGITLGSGTGNIVVAFSAANAALLLAVRKYFYDLRIVTTATSVPVYLCRGYIEIINSQTIA